MAAAAGVLVVACLLNIVWLCVAGDIKDVELIPEQQRALGAELLGQSLSLRVGRRRGFVEPKLEEINDQKTAESSYVHPHLGSSVAYEGEEGGQDYYGREEAGGSGGQIGFYGNNGRHGSSGRVSEGRYRDSQRSGQGDRADSGYYSDNKAAQKGYGVGSVYAGGGYLNQDGQAVRRFGNQGGHRKGHHSSGFHNSYHKDESANNSSFFDDGSDAAGHLVYDSRGGAFRNQAGGGYKGGFQDGSYRDASRGRQGGYGSSAGFDDRRGKKGSYAQNEYHDDRAKYGQLGRGQRFGGGRQAGGHYSGGSQTFSQGHESPIVVGVHGGPSTGYVYYDTKAKNYYVPAPQVPPPEHYADSDEDYDDVGNPGYTDYEDSVVPVDDKFYGGKPSGLKYYSQPRVQSGGSYY